MWKLGFLSLCFALVSLSGCGSDSKTPKPVTEPSAASRPALKIWIVDAPELEREISVRWQAASDQSLKIENLSSDAIGNREPFVADVVIYPGLLLGDLVHKDVISRLPSLAIAKRETDGTENVGNDSRAPLWPSRWRQIASFGGQLYAVPMGAANLGVGLAGLDSGPFDELDKLLSNRDLNAPSMEQWTLFLKEAESALAASAVERKEKLQTCLSKISPEEKAWLVDRFLFIGSTTNARSRGLFNLTKMQSRLNQPDFSNSAKILCQLARLFPDTIAVDPAKAWDLAAFNTEGAAAFALGWPSPLGGTTSESKLKVKVAPLIWNPGRGLVASIGKKTRQTAVSCQFLVWLAEPDQREAFRAVCPRIELAQEQNDRRSVRDDYRAYQSINARDTRVEPMELSLRMANANQYRAILADYLVSAIREPDQVDAILADCSAKWDQLTANLGVDSQRISEEQSLGFRK